MPQAKPGCKVALINLDGRTASVFVQAFRELHIPTFPFEITDYRELGKERFDGCVLKLSPGFEPITKSLRDSRRDKSVFVYGLMRADQKINEVSGFGINVLIQEPITRQRILQILRPTYHLVLHEFRRYVRVPLVAEAELKSQTRTIQCSTVELSGGGMSLQTDAKLATGDAVQCFIKLPNGNNVECAARVCWTKPESNLLGVQFDASDRRRQPVKKWVEEYLGM